MNRTISQVIATVTNSSLNSFKSAVDNYFMTSDSCFIVNVFNVIIISVLELLLFTYYCVYVIERVYSLNPQLSIQS